MATPHNIETLDQAGRRVRVGPGDPGAKDVLEYAQLLIETEGWNQINTSGQESSRTTGWSLHDSIGEACRRLSSTDPTPHSRGGSKDAVYQAQREGQAVSVSLRAEAQGAVDAELGRMAEAGDWTPSPNAARTDYDYNDGQGRTQDEIIAVLQRAREAV